ncbi:ATP-binding protein, partial [Vibrio minamisatsumaniensis]
MGKSEFKDKKSNYKTVVIGENGTGKTRLLNEIISTIRNKYDKEKKNTKESSCVNLINERSFEKIVAISTSFNDKLPFSDNDKFSDEHYQYCGIRETSNASWTSSLMRKTLDNLLVCIENNDSPKIKKIMEFLGLSNRFRITFNLKKPNKFNLLEAKESDLINYIHFYSQNTSRMQVEKIRDFSLEQARSIMNNFIPLMQVSERNEYYIEIKVSNKTEGIVGVFENLEILRRVGIISSVSLNLSKNEKASNYSFTNASSGEAQLLFTMTAFLRYVSN